MGGFYGAVAIRGFRRYATYRIATAAGIFTNTVFGLIISYSYIALWDQRPHLGGYSEAQALTYVWIGQALLAPTALMGGGFENELMERIRSGAIAVDLYRPADLQGWWLASDFGRAAFQLAGRGVLPIAAGSLVFDLALPADPVAWLLFAVAIGLGLTVSFAIRFLVGLSAFWLLDGAGVAQIVWIVALFFSGMLLPLNAFPGTLSAVAQALPWAAILQVPADVLLGRRHGAGALAALAVQAGWAAALLAAGRLLQAVATRRVVVQGG
ncbi:ABC transporter permease [Actinacidiphila epipremni]|jgi:ABC-2 type transport system permease protein|uniref:ABC transporter permease n=1 Tax=Actinacidiphila epipremni TaxID=2053013 RepID=UPI001F0E4DB9|nr:ABC-2 family transporter protein [Actinacidiphila epipremni]